jgi:hypothetical protein
MSSLLSVTALLGDTHAPGRISEPMVLRGLSWRWICLLMALAALPMLAVSVPEASDYPNHLARMHVFSQIGSGSPLDRYFKVNWRWIGNLGVDLPVVLLAPWIGVETAVRLVAALIAPLTVVGILMLSRATHGRITGSAMIALPFVFAQPYLFGFINYCLSVALALILAALWIATPRPTPLRLIGFAVGALIVWTAHLMGWAILLLIVAGSELSQVRSARDLLVRAVRAAPLITPVIPLFLWRSSGGGVPFWQDPDILTSKFMNFVTVLKGLWLPFDLGMTIIIGLVAGFALLSASGRRVEPRLATGAGLLVVTALLLPTKIFESWAADLRLTSVAVMVAIMAIGPAVSPRRERLLLAIGASLFILRAAWTTVQWRQGDRVLSARLNLLNAVPIGSRLGFLSVDTSGRVPWTLTPDRKLGGYAVTRRNAFTNSLFQTAGSDVMSFRSATDRARWFDGSQDITDLPMLNMRIAQMQADGFGAIWVAGLRVAPPVPGYTVAYSRGTDTLFLKSGSRAAPR